MRTMVGRGWMAALALRVLAACGDDGFDSDGGEQHLDGGDDSGLPADYFACEVPSDCMTIPVSCCGTCGAPTRGDAIAIAKAKAAAYASAVCEDGGGCPACAPLFIDPTLIATCRALRCELVDLYEHPASACTTDEECAIRTPECCPCGGDTSLGRLVAVSSANAYQALVCDPDQACPECSPVYLAEVTASCNDDDRCEAHDARIPGATASCEVDGVVYPSGTRDIADPASCNRCVCDDGQLICTDINCPEPCPSGTAFGVDCSSCGPVDDCQVVRTGCLPACEGPDDCAEGACNEQEGICLNLCG